MTETVDVDALIRMEIAEDGHHATVSLFDAQERCVTLELPIAQLYPLIAALPRHPAAEITGDALIVRAWRLEAAAAEGGVAISLVTPDGRTARFRVVAAEIIGVGDSSPQSRRRLVH